MKLKVTARHGTLLFYNDLCRHLPKDTMITIDKVIRKNDNLATVEKNKRQFEIWVKDYKIT